MRTSWSPAAAVRQRRLSTATRRRAPNLTSVKRPTSRATWLDASGWNTLIPQAVSAEVKNGAVMPRGEVEWAFQREDTEQAIRHLAGVRSVTNSIVVRPSGKAESGEIKERVEDAIERQANIDAHSISVTTEGGTVRPRGRVRSLAESRAAVKAAEAAPGVTLVENDLVIRP